MTGHSVSVPEAGGNATLTSIGTPSKLGTMPEQKRCPAVAPVPPCTVQFIAPLNTLGIAARADPGIPSTAATTAAMSILRTVFPPPPETLKAPLNHAGSDAATGRRLRLRAGQR